MHSTLEHLIKPIVELTFFFLFAFPAQGCKMLLHMSNLFMMVLIVFFYRRKSAFLFINAAITGKSGNQPNHSVFCVFSLLFVCFSWAGMRMFDWKSSVCLCCLVTGDFRLKTNVFSLFELIPHPFILELKWRKWLCFFLYSSGTFLCCSLAAPGLKIYGAKDKRDLTPDTIRGGDELFSNLLPQNNR